MNKIDKLYFLSDQQVRDIGAKNTPVYVYSKTVLSDYAKQALSFSTPFGTTVRYAMKANPHRQILTLFDSLGIQIDASSGYEADEALKAGVPAGNIRITSQELPINLPELLDSGVKFNATSLHQLTQFGRYAPGKNVGVRINPGQGDGINNRLTTGGVATSFGIWHEYIDEIKSIAQKYKLTIDLIHTHIGSGSDPQIWLEVAKTNLEYVKQFETVTKTSLGGGFKVPYMDGDPSTNMKDIDGPISDLLVSFEAETGRKIQLEIEPGRFLVAHAGSLITKIIDVKDTGKDGYNFIVLNAGLTEIIRPAMYGAQHKLIVVGKDSTPHATMDYVVSGHSCESGDCLTVKYNHPEIIEPRTLSPAKIGDYLCVETVGAYCASFSTKSYNSFPPAPEIFVD